MLETFDSISCPPASVNSACARSRASRFSVLGSASILFSAAASAAVASWYLHMFRARSATPQSPVHRLQG